jgi:hypothetical protein
MTVDGTTINASYGNSLQFAKIVLVNGGRIGSSNSTSQSIASLASNDSTTYWASGDFCNHYIKANGVTTFAGRLLWNGGTNTANFWLEGGSQNQLTLTGKNNTATVYARNGSKVILQDATFIGTQGQVRISAGSTISAGTSANNAVTLVYIDGTSALDVRARGTSTGVLNTYPGTSNLTNGWKVNLLDPLPAGTHEIWRNWSPSPALTVLPQLGTNLSGRTVTGFVWNNAVNPKTLSVTLV